MLDINITALYTFILVVVLLMILNKIFFKPIGNIIDKREEKIRTENTRITELEEEISSRSGELESVLKKTKKEARKIRETKIIEGETIRNDMVLKARTEATEMVDGKLADLDSRINEAEIRLVKEIEGYSNLIKEKFL